MSKLLTNSSAKLDKSQNDEYVNVIMYLDPLFDKKMCEFASAACRKCCLINTGRMAMDNAKQARRNRTELYRNNFETFKIQLQGEIMQALAGAMKQGKKLAARLNGTSDQDFSEFYEMFPMVQFYEYTKNPNLAAKLAKYDNVHVTFSKHENHTMDDVKKVLDTGVNVAVVFKDAVPTELERIPVINGDLHDRRFEDTQGKIVGLKLKGTKRLKEIAIKRGFAI